MVQVPSGTRENHITNPLPKRNPTIGKNTTYAISNNCFIAHVELCEIQENQNNLQKVPENALTAGRCGSCIRDRHSSKFLISFFPLPDGEVT
jgi:hypothetical protein